MKRHITLSLNLENFLIQSILLTVLFLLATVSLHAQMSAHVEGKIIDDKSKKPVMYASVALHDLQDSALIAGVISDTTGTFAINNVPKGKYFLQIGYMGYQNFVKNDIIIDNGTKKYEIGTIPLKEDVKQLDEVNVVEDRLKGVEEVDRTVYTISKKIAKASSSGLDVIRQVPGVQIDFRNNVSLQGNNNLLILIDDKERDSEYLAQIDPNSIDKVEVMTNPSTKYDADIDAVIIIKTKRQNRFGLSGYASAEIPTHYDSYISSSNYNLEYGYKNVRVYTSGYIHPQNFDNVNMDVVRKTDDYTLEKIANGQGDWNYYNLGYGLDWFIDDKNTLSLYGNTRPNTGGTFDLTGTKKVYEDDILTNHINIEEKEIRKSKSNYYSAFYKHTTNNPGQEFTLETSFYDYMGDYDKIYQDQYFKTDGITPIGNPIHRREMTDDSKNSLTIRADYAQNLGKKTRMEAGYHTYNQWVDNQFSAQDDAAKQELKYNEMRHAAYTNFSGKLKSLNWQAGLRFEHSNVEIDNDPTSKYYCFLPQFSLQKTLPNKHSLKFSYRKSIDRPAIYHINPFVNQVDSLKISHGNPELDPAYTHNVKLNYSGNIKSSYFSPELYFNYYDNQIQEIAIINENGITEQYSENIGKGYEYGLSLSASIKITDWWKFNPYVSVFNKTLVGDEQYNINEQTKASFRTTLTSVMTFFGDMNVISYIQYSSPYITAQNTNYRSALYLFAVEKGVLKTGKIGLYAYAPFLGDFTVERTEKETNDYYEESDFVVHDLTYIFNFKFSYRFNYGQKVKKLNRNKQVEEAGSNSMF